MVVVAIGNVGKEQCLELYPDNFIWIESKDYLDTDENEKLADKFIKYIEDIKTAESKYSVVVVDYSSNIIRCLDSLKISFLIVVGYVEDNSSEIQVNALSDKYTTVELEKGESLINVFRDVYHEEWAKEVKKIVDSSSDMGTNTDVLNEVADSKDIPDFASMNKNKLSLQELIESDVDITESDVRDLKATTNKLKVAMLLQAKSRLNMVLKLSNVLDKLYEEIVSRVEDSLESTDTGSLLYTAEQISKALNETNQFIMTLITNEKIQNFFIIDNSNVINISNDRVDINKREKIRKAAEIVIDNIEYFVQGDFDNIKNPNA